MIVMNIMKMMYILEVARFDEHGCQVCIFLAVSRYDEEVCLVTPVADPGFYSSVGQLVAFF
jgi:hypothetical protein